MRRKARALLDLATAIDAAVPLDDPLQWISLGDLLYEQGDASGAVRAYQAALRPRAAESALRPQVVRRVRGNLARAFAHEGHHARAEWLLRPCVYRAGDAGMGDIVDRWGVYQRLDLEGLRDRPTDAAEFGHAITRRVERLRADGHPAEAFAALREVRCVLAPLLGSRRDSSGPPAEDLFGAELVQLNAQRTWRARGLRAREARGRPFNPKAWAFSVLGKSYRLAAELALDLARSDARWYWERADKYLHYASNLDPLLPYPYAHRLHLLSDPRIAGSDREKLTRHLSEDLNRLEREPDVSVVVQRLRAEFPGIGV